MRIGALVVEDQAIPAIRLHLYGTGFGEGLAVNCPTMGGLHLLEHQRHAGIRLGCGTRVAEGRIVPDGWRSRGPARRPGSVSVLDDDSHARRTLLFVHLSQDPDAAIAHLHR